MSLHHHHLLLKPQSPSSLRLPPHPIPKTTTPHHILINPIILPLPRSKTLLKPLRSSTNNLATLLPSSPPLKSSNQPHKPCKQDPIPQSEQSEQLHPLSVITPYVLSQHTPILLGWLCSLVSTLSLSLLVPKLGNFSASFSKNDAIGLTNKGVVVGALFFVKLVATYWQHALLWDAALNAGCKIRVHIYEKVLGRELGFFEGADGVSAGDIAYRITAEAADVSDTLYSLLNTIVPSALQLSAMAVQMLSISPALSMISALVIPCVALATACLGEMQRKISRKANVSIATLSAYLNEALPAILFVKANNAELCESTRFQRLARADLSAHLKKKQMKSLLPQLIQIIYFGALFTLCAGSLVISRGCFNGCSMVSFVTSLIFLVEPIQDVGKAYNEWKQGEPAIERLFDLTRVKCKASEKTDAVDLDSVTGDVKFCGVSFAYGNSRHLVLNKLDLHIKAGETVALVGPSGGGKTTLVKLLLQLYEPSSGCILVDDQNTQNIRLESLRRHIGLVSQDTTLFSGTVAENIGYRDLMTEIDMEKVKLAAQTANADEFIRKLPNGYKTNIGPRGSSLSGGQKQRLAIARTLYQDSSILILDEATSALDSRSELLVRQALERLKENHTVLVIAHRLETVLMANRIFLLEDGKLKELARSTLLGGNLNSLASTGLVI